MYLLVHAAAAVGSVFVESILYSGSANSWLFITIVVHYWLLSSDYTTKGIVPLVLFTPLFVAIKKLCSQLDNAFAKPPN